MANPIQVSNTNVEAGAAIATTKLADGTVITNVVGGAFNAAGSNRQDLAAAGPVSTTVYYTALDSTAGAMAVTLAAPAAIGQAKVITLDVDGGAVTMLGTNIQEQAATTVTFSNAGESLLLVAGSEAGSTLLWVQTGGDAPFA